MSTTGDAKGIAELINGRHKSPRDWLVSDHSQSLYVFPHILVPPSLRFVGIVVGAWS